MGDRDINIVCSYSVPISISNNTLHHDDSLETPGATTPFICTIISSIALSKQLTLQIKYVSTHRLHTAAHAL